MTAQIPDIVVYDDASYSICGVNGSGLLTPEHFNETAAIMSSACWRGYVCTYSIVESKLNLTRLMFCNESKSYPVINGVKPNRKNIFKAADYENLNEFCAYTGGLLIANGFINGLYVHMGFHPAWKYKSVHKLIFETGKLIAERDCSEFMAEIRSEMAECELRPDHTEGRARVEEWIDRAFSLDYTLRFFT